MTPYTAHLLYRCRIATAADYTPYILETNPIQLLFWADTYKVLDIRLWAKEQIEGILSEAAELWPLFADDEGLVQSALGAVQPWAERLGRVGVEVIQDVRGGSRRLE